MPQETNAEIIAIGTEILLGEITDTNSVYLSRMLRDMGVNLYFMTSVGDNEARIEEAIRIALGRAQIVITCGGLGPTVDDMTRQSVAAATDRGLTFHQPLLDKIAERFNGFQMKMSENNRRQAFVPDQARIVENPVGTAPSFIVEQGEHCVISLPGVPREMKFLFVESIAPYLRERYQLGGKIIKARVLHTAGIGESILDEAIGTELLEASNPTVGLAAHSGQVDVRITAKADSEADADALIAAAELKLRERIDSYIYGVDAETVEDALLNELRNQNATLAINETGVEPLVSARLQSLGTIEGILKAVQHFDSVELLVSDLGTGELSLRQLAEAAAERISREADATLGVAVISRANTAEDRADSDEQSALAVYGNGKVRSRSYGFAGNNDVAQQWTNTWVMASAWRMLREQLG